MIIERTPLNMNEVEEVTAKIQDSEKKLKIEDFIKKFNKTKKDSARKIKDELEKLDSIKVKKEHIVKIADMLPSDASDLNKIFVDISLNEDETNKILGIVKSNQ
jgi:DNA-directed RNA polymerase subunit F